MDQIYYTQCPIGYGLGASNGYQIKRITAGYPLTGDFRHLGVKAFPGGSRTLAPPVLRYRSEAGFAEVTRLTPRVQEYHTERGSWGRPGGVFAHGLRLESTTLASFGNWPAGLFDHPGWRTTDPEPTRGRLPEDLDVAAMLTTRPAEFAVVGSMFPGEDAGWLARVWTALAQVTRDGRTLFLIDEPDRLARSIAFLTFGFPTSLRSDLTFSTFHDRPEELPGYRIQGTSPAVRPNRLALLAQGIIADRTTGRLEPAVEPAPWAVTLAGWFTRRDPIDEADWSATDARAGQARHPDDPIDLIWADAWLDPLMSFPDAYRDRRPPESGRDWVRLDQLAQWSGRAGIGDEWLRHRGPAWWLDQARMMSPTTMPLDQAQAARSSLVAHAMLRDAWRTAASARDWGEAVAVWFGPADRAERDEAITTLFGTAPRAARPSFAQAIFRGLAPDQAGSTLARLRTHPGADRATLVPLEAGVLAAVLVEVAGRPAEQDPVRADQTAAAAAVRDSIAAATRFPGATSAALDAVAAVAREDSVASALLADAVSGAFAFDGPDGGREAIAWALRQEAGTATWLAPGLRPRLADPGRGEWLHDLRDRVAEEQRPRLARAVVAVADDPGLPDEAFRLAIERLVLPLAPRPHHPSWAETYLRRTPSTWDLFRRLHARETTTLGLPAWIDQARSRGEVSPEQAARVDAIRQFARSLSSGNPRSLVDLPIPTGSATDRSRFFRQMLGRLGGDQLEGLPMVLDACRAAWPGAFDPGAPGLKSLARPLADRLGPASRSPQAWLARMTTILDQLGINQEGGGYEPDGLLAEVIAALPTTGEHDPWLLRQFLFDDDHVWPTLIPLIRADLGQVTVAEAVELVDRWDNKIVKTAQPKILPSRFWELILNAADSGRLAAIVPARIKDLQSLGPLRWLNPGELPDSTGDLRDAYARTVPFDPLPTGRLPEVERWLADVAQKSISFDEPIPLREPEPEPSRLSVPGRERWRCLKALTEYAPTAIGSSSSRERSFLAWETDLPTAGLTLEDLYRFVGWIILGIDPTDPPFTDRLVTWLFRLGVNDPRRVSRWHEELPLEIAAEDQLIRARFVGTWGREVLNLAEEAKPARRREPRRSPG